MKKFAFVSGVLIIVLVGIFLAALPVEEAQSVVVSPTSSPTPSPQVSEQQIDLPSFAPCSFAQ